MGTSKSYIPPTNGEWTKAKRAVTRMVNGSVSDGLPNAVRKYASAVKTDDSFAEEFSKAVSGLLGISRGIRVNGLDRTLEEYEKEYLIGKTAKEIWKELYDEYASGGSTKEESLASDALSKALKNLRIESLDDLVNFDQGHLLIELLACFASILFAFMYEEQIRNKKSPKQTADILNEVERYIRSIMFEKVDISQLKDNDFINISDSNVVKNTVDDAYNTMKEYYGELN